MRPVGASTLIAAASRGNSKAHTSPSLPHTDRNRICARGGTRRNAEVRLRLAGKPPPVIVLDVLSRAVPTTVTVCAEASAEAAKAVPAG